MTRIDAQPLLLGKTSRSIMRIDEKAIELFLPTKK